MSRNNTIGIVGIIKTPPELILEAADWEREVYETTLARTRPSGTEDTYVLQFDGRAVGSKEKLKEITEGAEVLVGGGIRSENLREPDPGENRVKVYIYAEVIVVNDPPADDQNEVTICGNICTPPHFRSVRHRAAKGRRAAVASVIVAINSPTGTDYIPCVCFDKKAFYANTLKVGDYVEIYGRFHSRDYKKRIEGRKLPLLCRAYEVCAVRLKVRARKGKRTEPEKKGGSDA